MLDFKVHVTNEGLLALIEYELVQAREALKEPAGAADAREWCDEALKHVKMLMERDTL